jgi:SAM-dependent methyltransferase
MTWLTITVILLVIAFISFWYNLWILGIISILLVISLIWTWKFGAAWDPTPIRVVKKIFNYLDLKESDVVYDLGCGDGRVLIEAVKKYNCRAVGIELDPLRYLITLLRVKLLRLDNKIKVIWGDIFKQDLREATVVFCFLTQEANNKLEEKFDKELSYGTIVVSYLWRFETLRPINVIDDEIFIYMM